VTPARRQTAAGQRPANEQATTGTASAAARTAADAGILERHFAEIQALYARAAGGEVRDQGGVQLSASGLPARVVNAANLAQFSDRSADEAIEDVKAFFGRVGVPFRWFVGPTSTPSDLPERLAAADVPQISNTPGMALDIATMRDEPTTVAGLEVREVMDASDFEAWFRVCVESFPFDPVIAKAWRAVHEPLGFGDDTMLHNYIGWLDGRPVAVSALLHGRETAGIWNVGTLADVRGRGIGRETTLAALRDARAAGHRVSVLGSSPMGLPVYTRIGFVEVCRVRHFGPTLT
jgi:GNAT superfamily N-acetyltransferase